MFIFVYLLIGKMIDLTPIYKVILLLFFSQLQQIQIYKQCYNNKVISLYKKIKLKKLIICLQFEWPRLRSNNILIHIVDQLQSKEGLPENMSQEIELIGNIINKMQQAFNQVGLLVRDYQQRSKIKRKGQSSDTTDLLINDKVKSTKKIREKKDKIKSSEKNGVDAELINDSDKPQANKQKAKQVYTYDFDEQNKPNPIPSPSPPQQAQQAQLPQPQQQQPQPQPQQQQQPPTSKPKKPKMLQNKQKRQKKLTNPFTLFMRQQKEVLRQVCPKLEGTQFMQTMGKLWKQLQPTEREFYINKFQQIRALKKMESNANRIVIDQ